MRLVWATVAAIERSSDGAQTLGVALDDLATGRAIAYTRLVGSCLPTDRVLLNTTAVDLSLGTGGLHIVVARLGAGEGVALDEPSRGHIMKMRYTPSQVDVLAVEEQDSPHHAVMQSAIDLAGLPVACCGLHSHVPLVAAAIKAIDKDLRVAYVMTDSAALPLVLSDVIRASTDAGLVDDTITCGQAFGGDYEAVNVHSGLLAARHVASADVAIVAIGPGVVGTSTPFGHGGIAQAEAINATAALRGVPVACLRVSFADARARHHGVSHHSLTALGSVALARALVAIPTLPDRYAEDVESALESAGVWERHTRVFSSAGSMPPPSLENVEVKTMGRGLAQDPAFFAAAFAAGEVCARVAHRELGLGHE